MLISKRDVRSAFKLAPVSICDLAYMGCRFANYIGIYLALFSGRRPSPANWSVIPTLIMQSVAAHRPTRSGWGGLEGFLAFHYVGDGAFVEPWVGLRTWQTPSMWEWVLSRGLGMEEAIAENRNDERLAETRTVLWGSRFVRSPKRSPFPPAKK